MRQVSPTGSESTIKSSVIKCAADEHDIDHVNSIAMTFVMHEFHTSHIQGIVPISDYNG